MSQFRYKAQACAVGGRITVPSPHDVVRVAPCELPVTGGRASGKTDRPFRLELNGVFIFSYESAETTVKGEEESPGVHSTLVTCEIRKLNVQDVVKADRIFGQIQLRYDTRTKRVTIDTTGSLYENLTVAGEWFDVRIDHALGQEAADYAAFRRKYPNLPEEGGVTKHTLGVHPKLKPHHHHPNFGKIYCGGWTAAPKTQSLALMTLALGSPVEGNLDVGVMGGNGDDPDPGGNQG